MAFACRIVHVSFVVCAFVLVCVLTFQLLSPVFSSNCGFHCFPSRSWIVYKQKPVFLLFYWRIYGLQRLGGIECQLSKESGLALWVLEQCRQLIKVAALNLNRQSTSECCMLLAINFSTFFLSSLFGVLENFYPD